MKFRLMSVCVVLLVAVVMVNAQEATPVPPNCPAFPNESDEVRTSYYMGEGLAYFRTSQLSLAENSFSCIIEVIDGSYVPAYMNRAAVYTASRLYDDAIADYTEAISRQENLAEAFNNRAILYTALGKFDEAQADFDQVLTLSPNNLAGFNNKAVFQAVQGDVEGAIATLNEAIALSGVDQQLAELSDPKRAADAPEVKVDPIAARSYALLGIMNTKLALNNYQAYLLLVPSGDYRIADIAGSLESRFTFDLRLEDGTWWLTADYNATIGQ